MNLQRKTLATLATGQVLVGIGITGTVAPGSLLMTEMTNSETFAGLTQTSGVIGAALMAIPLAKLTQRGGRRLALMTGLSFGALGCVLAVIAGTWTLPPLLLVAAMLVGFASASSYQARFAATDLAPAEHRARHLSVVVWGTTVGAVMGPNLMAPSAKLARIFGIPDLVGPYLIGLTALVSAAIFIAVRLRPDPYLVAHRSMDAPAMRPPTKETLRVMRRTPSALLGLTAVMTGHIAMVSIMVMTPVHMKHVDVTLSIIGLVLSVHVAGMYALSPLMGWLADKKGRVFTIRLGVLILITSAIISGTADANDAPRLALGLFLLGLGWSATLVSGSTLLAESMPLSYKAASQGTSDLLMNISGAVGGAVAGIVIAELSYGWLCALGVIPVIVVGLFSVGAASASSLASAPLE